MPDTKTSLETAAPGGIAAGDVFRLVRPGSPNLDYKITDADLEAFVKARGIKRTMGYRSGAVHRFAPFGTANNQAQTNVVVFVPMIVEAPVTLDRAALHIITAAPGCHVAFGIYNHDDTTGRPTTLISGSTGVFDASVQSAIVTQLVAFSGGALTLQPGRYWRATLCDLGAGSPAAPTVTCVATTDAQATNMIGQELTTGSLLGGVISLAYAASSPAYSAGLPSTAGTLITSAGNAPLPHFRVA